MRFLADVGISPQTAVFLRELGHDAVHVREQNLQRASDAEIILKARQENRIVLTHDLDFGALMAASGKRLPSVILFRLSNMRPDNVNVRVEQILHDHADILNEGALLSVSDGQIRVRRLPIR